MTAIDRTPARDFRPLPRGDFRGATAGQALGFAQANLVVLPRDWAFDFLLFCQRNPKPCPLLDVTEPGDPEPRGVAPGSDLRTDLPLYRVFRDGVMTEEVPDLLGALAKRLRGFPVGLLVHFRGGAGAARDSACAISTNQIPRGEAKNVPMYRTNRPCRPAGRFRGPLVVSMRPYRPGDAVKAAAITARYPQVHGAPVHFGDPGSLGVRDLTRPDYGDPVSIEPGEVPVFWACGVTPQAAILEAKPPIAIAHSPGHMFVCDVTDDELAG